LKILQDPFSQEATLEALAVLASGDDSLCFSLFSRNNAYLPPGGLLEIHIKKDGLLVRNIEKNP